MFQVNAQTKIYLAVEPVDFRKGIDGLIFVCKHHLKEDPYSGSLYLFKNKRSTAIKLLYFDTQGWWLAMKRLASGKFQWWPKGESDVSSINLQQLQVLLWTASAADGNPQTADFQKVWREN